MFAGRQPALFQHFIDPVFMVRIMTLLGPRIATEAAV
jgi:hypothetical protein